MSASATSTLFALCWLLFAPLVSAQSVSFDGIDDHVTIGADTGLAVRHFTVEAWFKRATGGKQTTIASRSLYPLISRGNGSNFFLGLDFEGRLYGALRADNGGRWVRGESAVPLGEWHHGAVTCDGIVLRLYLDGVHVAETNLDLSSYFDVSTTPSGTRLGQVIYQGVPAGAFSGQMAEARIWNVARTQAEIENTRTKMLTFAPGLLARWSLRSGDPTFASDGDLQISSSLANGATSVPDGPPLQNVAPSAEIVSPLGPISATPGSVINFTATAADPDDAIVHVEFYAGHIKFGEDTEAPFESAWTVPPAGIVRIRAVAVDAAGNRNGDADGTVVSIVPTPGTEAVYFDGKTGHAELSASAALNLTQFTIETSFYMTGDGTPARLATERNDLFKSIVGLVHRRSFQGHSYFLGIHPSDNRLVGGRKDILSIGRSTIARNAWHHAALTFDGEYFRLFLDGILESERRIPLPFALQESTPAFTQLAACGTVSSTGFIEYSGMFEGLLDEVRIWDRPLPPGLITGNRNLRLLNAPGLVARWGLDEPSGTTILGSGASAIDGTLVGQYVRSGGVANATGALPTATLTAPASPVTLLRGQTQPLEADAAPAAGAISRVEFWDLRQKLGEDSSSPYAFAWEVAPTGLHQVTAVAIDDQGRAGASSPVTVTVNPSPGSGALHFDGVNDYASTNLSPVEIDQFTIELWFRREDVGTTGSSSDSMELPLTSLHHNQVEWNLGITPNSGALFTSVSKPAIGFSSISGNTSVTYGVWHHAAVTYDGEFVRLYLDGLMQGSPVPFDSEGPSLSELFLQLGGYTFSSAFAGDIADVRVWNYARSQTEIVGSKAQLITVDAGLLSRWGFAEGTGTTAAGTGSATGSLALNGAVWTSGPGHSSDVPPQVAISSPTAASSFPINIAFPVTCTASDPDGTIAKVELYLGSTKVGEDDTAPFEFTVTPSIIRPDTLRAVAVDNQGFSSSIIVPVNITPPIGGSGLYFDGVDDYVSIATDPQLGGAQFTIETWVRRDGPGKEKTNASTAPVAVPLVVRGDRLSTSQTEFNYALSLLPSGQSMVARGLFSYANSTGTYNSIWVDGTTSLEVGAWHHLALTYDGRSLRLYVDGQLDGSIAVSFVPIVLPTLQTTLGAVRTSAGVRDGAFHGFLDEVRIWNHARTAEAIAADRWRTTFSDPSLIAQWSMGEGSGPTLENTGASDASGTISGAARTIDHPPPASPVPSVQLSSNVPAPILGQSINLQAAPVAGSGTVQRVEFFANSIKLGEAASTPWSLPFAPAQVGRYHLNAIVHDSAGGIAASNDLILDVTPPSGAGALYLDGEDDFVELPSDAEFSLPQYTVEGWIRRDGPGRPSHAHFQVGWVVPIFAHGVEQATDFFLGLLSDGKFLVKLGDYQFTSNTQCELGEWCHVALVYDGTNLRLYINGLLDRAEPASNFAWIRAASAPALGCAHPSPVIDRGAFHGALDEVRLWSVPRTASEISANRTKEIHAARGLVARYGLNEPSGSLVADSAGAALHGKLRNGGFRIAGVELVKNAPPSIISSEPTGGLPQTLPVTLAVQSTDPAAEPLTASFKGRELPREMKDFTIVVLPELQNYTGSLNGGSPATLHAMMDWIVANRVTENIVHVAQTGLPAPSDATSWTNCSNAFAKLENPLTTGLPAGIPYSLDPYYPASVTHFNSNFGPARYVDRPWKIGTGTTNGSLILFTGGGIDFAILEESIVATSALTEQLELWPERQFIVVAESASSSFSDHPNVALVLSRSPGENRQIASMAGRTIPVLGANYNNRPNGGDGWMRLLRFSPASGRITVQTWSPTRSEFEADPDSEFSLRWTSLNLPQKSPIASAPVQANGSASVPWPELIPGRHYEWAAEVSDGTNTVPTAAHRFSIPAPPSAQPPIVAITSPAAPLTARLPAAIYLQATASSPDDTVESVEWLVNGTRLGADTNAPFTFLWRPIVAGTYQVTAAATDRRGLRTLSAPVTITVNASAAGTVTASVTSPVADTMLYDAGTIKVAGTATSFGTTITGVDFFADKVLIGSDASAPFEVAWSYSGFGPKRLHAIATAANGVRAISPAVRVEVAPMLSPTITRAAFPQRPSPHSVTVRWRTSESHPGRVWYGTVFASQNSFADESIPETNHEVTLTGLQPNTRYYYGVGSPSKNIPTLTYFTTPPLVGRAKNTRIWIAGDAGQGNSGQTITRNSYTTFTGTRGTDLFLSLGDQAYNSGFFADFQSKFFTPYANVLNRTFCFPSLGERDTNGSTTYSANIAYYSAFSLPSNGESGGVPSGTGRYYSFDYANIHFVCLDSQTSDRSAGGAMATWLQADLVASTARWKIAYWHHPPYSQGGQDSDAGAAQTQMRSVFVPILEQHNVDLVLGAHSRNYERSWLMAGHTGASNTFQESMKKDPGLGRPATDGAYVKGVNVSQGGTVYVVAGNAASLDAAAPLAHPAMAVNLRELGTGVIDVHGAQLDFRMLNSAGSISDHFTIVKPWSGADSDGDEMLDEFEDAYGLNKSGASDALLDADGDGTTNRDEYAAGTDPTDSKSRLVRAIEKNGNSFIVRFSTVPNARYQVEYSDSLSVDTWINLGDELIGTGQEMTVTDVPPPETLNRFYRVKAFP